MGFSKKALGATIFITIMLIAIAVLLMYQRNLTAPKQQFDLMMHDQIIHHLEEKKFKTEATVAGIGDILIHDWVYEDAKTSDGYDFKPMFEKIKPILQKPDFLIANQESVPGGTEIGISNYPRFNSPHEIIDAIMDAGVDMVTTANNHSIDRGEPAAQSAIAYYEKKSLPYTGSFKSPEDQGKMRIEVVNGIRMAVLSYAEHTNGIPIPEGKDYLVNLLDREQILADINDAKTKADLIILALHWGDEYVRYPKETQKQLATELIQAGADIILGSHSHVLQPIEMIEKSDGQFGVVIYSLGNFLSGQLRNYKDIGGMIEIKVEKEGQGTTAITTIQDIDFHPTFTTSKQFRNYKIYPLEEANINGLTDQESEEIINFMFKK